MVEIPIPPSANNLWRVVGNRSKRIRVAKSERYEGWVLPTVLILRAGLPKFTGPVVIEVVVRGGIGFATNRDIDNTIKGVVDALRLAERIPDDTVKTVLGVSARYEPPAHPGDRAACFVSVKGADRQHPGG